MKEATEKDYEEFAQIHKIGKINGYALKAHSMEWAAYCKKHNLWPQ